MPWSPPKPCNHPGCGQLVHERYCAEHKRETRKAYDTERGSARERGYDSRWDRYRRTWIAAHPLCVECLASGIVKPTEVVDHIVPHRGDRKLFWDPKNHQSLCRAHHDTKTAREDGGFGNPRRQGVGGSNL